MKIIVLGGTGMLGSAVALYLRHRYTVTATYRNEELLRRVGVEGVRFDAQRDDVSLLFARGYDYAINCIGVLRPYMDANIEPSIYVNAVFPHTLARVGTAHDCRVIHISSDAVFAGTRGKYLEIDRHDALDAYAWTKSLGEPKDALVLRTSVIGEELRPGRSLVSWARQYAGGTVHGFANHRWNGVTAGEYARIVTTIIDRDLFVTGVRHVYSPRDVSKLELLTMLDEVLGLGLSIENVDADQSVDRTLRTVHDLNAAVGVRDLATQLANLKGGDRE